MLQEPSHYFSFILFAGGGCAVVVRADKEFAALQSVTLGDGIRDAFTDSFEHSQQLTPVFVDDSRRFSGSLHRWEGSNLYSETENSRNRSSS